jgi:hypothetical protein
MEKEVAMHRWMQLVLGALVGLSSTVAGAQPIPAFSGADGAAANVTGGRGGIVYHVTKLNESYSEDGPGSLKYGLTNSNFPAGVPRTIVFDVGGIFKLGRTPVDGWDANGNGWDPQSRFTLGGTNITIAGQTAPGAGVIFQGGGLKPQGNNNIIRNISIASGYGLSGWWKPGDPFPSVPGTAGAGSDASQWFPDNIVYDGMDISGTNIMIDHVSTLFTTDEGVSMNEAANNITVQYSNISQGLNYPQWDAEGGGLTGHALGSLLGAGNQNFQAAISFHHNLYAHQKGRVPTIQRGETGAFYDFRNNVFYNWLSTAGSKGGTNFLNLVNNFYLAGNGGDNPIGGTNPGVTTQGGGTSVMGGSSTVHRNGNWIDNNKNGNPSDGGPLSNSGAANPFWKDGVDTYSGATDSPENAFDRVLDYVGPNWWTRDDVIDTPDERIIHEARTGTGKIIAWADDPWNDDPNDGVEWQAIKNTPQTTRGSDWDTEASVGYGVGDGMPTYWELQHGLDPHARDDTGDFDNDGYTNLEEYLNDVAAWPAPNAIAFNNAKGDGRFAHILNWDANPDAGSVHPWQPSRYDTAVIDNGTVTVDSVGQHAGNLLLATNPGDNATLNITAGWIKVEDAPHGLSDGMTVIGDNNAATAALNLSGGKLTTKALVKGDGGTFNFTGGTLSAEAVGFDLVNDGGTIAPGESPGMTHVMGDLVLNSGVLQIEVGGTGMGQYDMLVVDGETTLGGTLQVVPFNLGGGLYAPALGDTFLLVASQNGFGTEMFDALDLPQLATGLEWALSTDTMSLALSVVEVAALAGDYNNDGTVDAADYTVWRDHFGQASLPFNETASLGTVDQEDYDAWKTNFGTSSSIGAGAVASVPEPSGSVLALGVAFVLCHLRRHWRAKAVRPVMQRASIPLLLVLLVLLAGKSRDALAQIPAFPGAEGPGANATGGRGGDVYHVTNLEADTNGDILGSLRYGIRNAPATGRTIVFDVGGVINLPQGPTTSKWFSSGTSNITVAGQTAPGPGITIAGNGAKLSGSNVIFQHISFRPGPHQNHPINTNDALSLQLQNSVVSHVSATWATDEGISLTDNAKNTTVQYSVIAETLSDDNHHFGSLISSEHDHAPLSFHHNLYAHSRSRLPRIGNEKSAGAIVNFSNNIIYNWNGRAAYSIDDKPARANFLSNYYIAGPNGSSGDRVFYSPDLNTRIYHDGNMVDMNKNGSLDGVSFNFTGPQMQGTFTNEATPFVVESGYVQTAAEAYEQVLAHVGARWWERDNIDARIVNDVQSAGASGSFLPTIPTLFNMPTYAGYEFPHDPTTGLPTYQAVSRLADWDTSGDGMPDWWKIAHGMDPDTQDHNGDVTNNGYTNLEEYLHYVAAFPAPKALAFTNGGGDNRYAMAQNWELSWKPSRFDVVELPAGTATVDAVGQHAGTIRIGTQAGVPATLQITAGWLEVADEILIGTGISKGHLVLSGGRLNVPTVSLDVFSDFKFTGGTLSADSIGFDLVNEGGTIAPGRTVQGPAVGMTQVAGGVTLDSGSLEIDLFSATSFDQLEIDGAADLGGELVVVADPSVNLAVGDTLLFLHASGGIFNAFESVSLPQLDAGKALRLLYGETIVGLEVILAGDYNNDGQVDAADYTVWRDSLESGGPLLNETASPGTVDQADYDAWKTNFGATAAVGAASTAVPEPATWLLATLTLTCLPSRSRLSASPRTPKT